MTIAALGICSIRRDASRAFVRAAFTAGNHNIGTTTIRTTGNNRLAVASFTNRNLSMLCATSRGDLPSSRSGRANMSAAPIDSELDKELDEILGETDPVDTELDKALEEILAEATEVEEGAVAPPSSDIDKELEEIFGEALSEAENPAVDEEVGGRGHIEGSHPFPKELIEEVRCFIFFVFVVLAMCEGYDHCFTS